MMNRNILQWSKKTVIGMGSSRNVGALLEIQTQPKYSQHSLKEPKR